MKPSSTLTSILIALSTLGVVAAIIVPPYLRSRREQHRIQAFVAGVQPALDALIAAEGKYKEREGKFWRDQHENIDPAAAKQALGVDLPTASDYQLAIYPADLAADPTLRVAAKGAGDAQGLTFECVYDSIAHTKSCKLA
jgi:type II secretory pathway pseudopilin PulG